MDLETQDASPQPAQTQKFLRYRSVRKSTNNTSEPQTNSPPPLPQTSQTSLTRLPSRYHRRTPATQSAPPLNVPPIPSTRDHATPSRTRGKTFGEVLDEEVQARHGDNGGRRMVIQHSDSRPGTRPTTNKTTSRKQTLTSNEEVPEPEELRRSYEAAREEARLILEGEHDRLRALRQREAKRRQEERQKHRQQEDKAAEEARQLQAEAHAKEEAEIAVRREVKLKAAREKQKIRRHAEAGETEYDADPATATEVQPNSKGSRMRTMVIGGPPLSNQGKRGHRRSLSAVEKLRPKRKDTHARTNSASRIDEIPEAEAQLSKPNFDAPISAVNAGERRVSVKCKEAFITLPITPSTTAREILSSASLCMSESIDPQTAVLLESFSQLGLERPLRRYERIRDVMNSWDNDSQNHLFIMAASDCAAPGLQVAEAPSQQPYGTNVQIYHSQKPGKWDKRWLKLREDGQITTSKHEHGVDSINICHVSDFDLYTPTARQMKKLKPPKKLCYAFKSQEKSAMFLEGANFVHFFCTKDKEVADRWYRAVHSWRSWYLVTMLGEGERERAEPSTRLQLGTRPGTSNSKETLPYVLGSFKPLDFESSFDADRRAESGIRRRPSQAGGQRPLIDFVPSRPSIDESAASPNFVSKTSGAPPTAFPRKFMAEAGTIPNDHGADGPFTANGLLARSASSRVRSGSRTGHGVPGVDGKPLIDLAPMSEFTDGSLLRKMEKMAVRGGLEPKIDRQKRREADVAVGEGF